VTASDVDQTRIKGLKTYEKVGISRVHLNRKLKAFGKESPGALIKTFLFFQLVQGLFRHDAPRIRGAVPGESGR